MSLRQKPTKTITSAYTTTDADNGYRIICNSSTDFTITLHSATGRYNFELEIDNIGVGAVVISSQTLKQYTHAHIGNNGGTEWTVVLGGSSSSEYELTKAKVEEVLIGEISSHTHPVQEMMIPQATEAILGGIKAKIKTIESNEIAIDPNTGKLYAPSSSRVSGIFDYGKITDTVDITQDWGGLM